MIEDWNLLVEFAPRYAFKLFAAFVCGVLIGVERERKDKPAGLRTIVLITVGATLYMIVSDLVALTTEGPEAITRVDPSRIASQVVTGIGFLGAGTIIQARGSVHGLTTAATIWVAAGIGLCVGVGFPVVAMVTTVLVLIVLVILDPIREWLSHRGTVHEIAVRVHNDSLTIQRVDLMLTGHGVKHEEIRKASSEGAYSEWIITYHKSGDASERFLNALARMDGIEGVPQRPG